MSDNTTRTGRNPRVLAYLLDELWAIERNTLAAICEFATAHHYGITYTDADLAARVGEGPARRDLAMHGDVAVIPVHGVISPRADLMTDISGGTSVDRLRSSLAAAVDDKDVKAIVLDVNSPGGSVSLIPEMAREIRQARGRKPILANANVSANSAAYWLASQADELVGTDSARVGSIGVYAPHEDISAMQEKIGVKTTLVSAGPRKLEGNPYEPLSDEARVAIQERVDEAYAMFTLDVAKGRRVPVEQVRDGYGQGGVLTAKQALKAGMLDAVETIDQTIARAAAGAVTASAEAAQFAVYFTETNGTSGAPPGGTITNTTSQAAASGLSFADQLDALHDSAVAARERLTSLAEVERGHLTVAKRERLAACTEALADVVDELGTVLEATDPDKHRRAALRERAQFERLRMTSIGGQT